MREIQMFALYDVKVQVYDTPIFFLNEASAKRWFYTLVQEGKGRFKFFKDEMELHKLASFDVINGKVIEIQKTIVLEGNQIQLERNMPDENSDAA